MTDPRRAALLLGIGTIVLLIGTACAAPPPPIEGSTPTGSAASPANDGAEPLPVLPIGCADLLGVDALQQTIPSPLEVWTDESSTPRGFDLIAYRQAGGLHCVWGGEGGTDGVPDVGVQLWVTPDASDEFREHATGAMYPEGDLLVNDTIEGASVLDCGTGEFAGLSCTADALAAGDWWVYLTARADSGDARSYDDAVADTTALAESIIAGIASAGEPRPAWTAPDATDGSAWCEDTSLASVALGVDADGILVEPYRSPGVVAALAERAGGSQCIWSTADESSNVRIRTLQGGAWVFDRLAAEQLGAGEVFPGEAQPIETPADGALLACGDGCNAVLDIGNSLVVLDNLNGDTDSLTATVQQLAAMMSAGA
jgi:hypothetical protein